MNIQHLRADYLINKYFHRISLPHVPIDGLKYNVPFVLTLLFIAALLFVIRRLLSLKYTLTTPTILLELTPPANTEKSAYTTQQLFATIYELGNRKTFKDRLMGIKRYFSFEIVSTHKQGIRYLIRTDKRYGNNFKQNVLSYLPQVRVKEVPDYLPEEMQDNKVKIVELELTKHFAYPLQKQDNLEEHDPVAYITGMMTKLSKDELLSFQIVLSPIQTPERKKIKEMILRGEDIFSYLDKYRLPVEAQVVLFPFKLVGHVLMFNLNGFAAVTRIIVNDLVDARLAARQAQMQDQAQSMMQAVTNKTRPARVLTPSEQFEVQSVEKKIDQKLFLAQIRFLMVMKTQEDITERENGFLSSLAIYSGSNDQVLQRKFLVNLPMFQKFTYIYFKKRLLSLITSKSNTLLSVSEISDLYHFPFAQVTQTENIVKALSRDLPAPLSLKSDRQLHVEFGKNTFGGTTTPIGLVEEERETHMYIIGRTGSGKTTMMATMARSDIANGEGVAFIDPHGDVSDDLVACTPLSRKDDLIFINPFDLKYPVGINILELTPGLDEDDAELEKEVVAEGVISLFRKVFSKEENANAHRIEYILRNTIYTAFTVKDATLFTIYNLLNNPDFQKKVIKNLSDENLKNFWKNEFGRAGSYQIVKMVGGVTAKIGRFLFSPTARRILEQPKSTINFDEIMNSGKILICNFSQGKLGEDTSRVLGITVMTKLQQAALKRASLREKDRKPFHLYVDEFQNFATQSFTKLLSEGRKYKLRIIIAEQSTSQQEDRRIVNVILANVTTVVAFRSANPVDEELMLSQFFPYVQKGDIANLPRYHFYIKISALDPEEPFSGETLYNPVVRDEKRIEMLIQASRDNWAIVYKRKTQGKTKLYEGNTTKDSSDISHSAAPEDTVSTVVTGALPH